MGFKRFSPRFTFKNTILIAISAIIVFLAISISAPMVSVFSEGALILNYVPGNGASGYVKGGKPGHAAWSRRDNWH